ncbi:MAG: DUF169 domain-containing protein [Pseudomonadota bacterium]
MPFIIDQNQCVKCGACIGNCPNRAIIRRRDSVIITGMCSDCGICMQHCGLNAISRGADHAVMDNLALDRALKENLSLSRNIVAMKFADTAPEGVAAADGLNFWCHICGDIFEGDQGPIFFTALNSVCGGASALGLGARNVNRDDVLAVIEVVAGDGGYYTTNDLFTKARTLFPRFPRVYGGLVIGSLEKVSAPDCILFPVNATQMCKVATAYAFETGEIISGSAGGGTCLATVVIPFVENRPVFSCGDHGGRVHMRLRDEESLVCFPYRLVPGMVKNLPRTVCTQE